MAGGAREYERVGREWDRLVITNKPAAVRLLRRAGFERSMAMEAWSMRTWDRLPYDVQESIVSALSTANPGHAYRPGVIAGIPRPAPQGRMLGAAAPALPWNPHGLGRTEALWTPHDENPEPRTAVIHVPGGWMGRPDPFEKAGAERPEDFWPESIRELADDRFEVTFEPITRGYVARKVRGLRQEIALFKKQKKQSAERLKARIQKEKEDAEYELETHDWAIERVEKQIKEWHQRLADALARRRAAANPEEDDPAEAWRALWTLARDKSEAGEPDGERRFRWSDIVARTPRPPYELAYRDAAGAERRVPIEALSLAELREAIYAELLRISGDFRLAHVLREREAAGAPEGEVRWKDDDGRYSGHGPDSLRVRLWEGFIEVPWEEMSLAELRVAAGWLHDRRLPSPEEQVHEFIEHLIRQKREAEEEALLPPPEPPPTVEEIRAALRTEVIPGQRHVFERNFAQGIPILSRQFGLVPIDEIAEFGLREWGAGWAADETGESILVMWGRDPDASLVLVGPWGHQDDPVDLPGLEEERAATLARLGIAEEPEARIVTKDDDIVWRQFLVERPRAEALLAELREAGFMASATEFEEDHLIVLIIGPTVEIHRAELLAEDAGGRLTGSGAYEGPYTGALDAAPGARAV